MVAVLVVVAFRTPSTLGPLVRGLLGGVPGPLRTRLVATIQVVLLTYLIMPSVTRAMAFWLYPRAAAVRGGA